MGSAGLPSKMKALSMSPLTEVAPWASPCARDEFELLTRVAGYEKPEVFSVVEAPLPQLREHDILVCACTGMEKKRRRRLTWGI